MSSDRTAALITVIAETHVHPGVGQSTGAIDLPVARERVSDDPFIPGSSVKEAFRVWAGERAGSLDVDRLFGEDPQGGDAGASGRAGARADRCLQMGDLRRHPAPPSARHGPRRSWHASLDGARCFDRHLSGPTGG